MHIKEGNSLRILNIKIKQLVTKLTWGSKCRTESPKSVETAMAIMNVRSIEKFFPSLKGATRIPIKEPKLITMTATMLDTQAENTNKWFGIASLVNYKQILAGQTERRWCSLVLKALDFYAWRTTFRGSNIWTVGIMNYQHWPTQGSIYPSLLNEHPEHSSYNINSRGKSGMFTAASHSILWTLLTNKPARLQ